MKTIVDYATKVKEQHALNKTLAPVETDLTDASRAYAIGEQFIYNGELFKAKTAIAQHDALVLNTNYEAADNLATEIEALTKEAAATLNTLGAKNFLETLIGSGTTQGITYTINADGSITLNGTCTAWTNIKLDYIAGQKNIPSGSYILNGSISGNNKFRLNTYVDGTKMAESENGNEASFTIPSTATEVYTRFEIDSTATFNNETFYPMIRLSSIEDDTYAPYAKTNRELTAENQTLTQKTENINDVISENGAKNLLPIDLATLKAQNTASGSSWNGNTYTWRDVSYTLNDDGTISVVTSGTTSLASQLNIVVNNSDDIAHLVGKNVALSGCPSGGASNTYNIRYNDTNGNQYETGNGISINSLPANAKLYISVEAGANYSTPKVFKPMITLASQPNSDYAHYVPYAMTNRELTEVKTAVSTNGNLSFVKVGRVVLCKLYANNVTLASGDSVGNIPDGFIPLVDGLQMVETVQMKMFSVSANNKNITTNNAYTNSNLRGTAMWLV